MLRSVSKSKYYRFSSHLYTKNSPGRQLNEHPHGKQRGIARKFFMHFKGRGKKIQTLALLDERYKGLDW